MTGAPGLTIWDRTSPESSSAFIWTSVPAKAAGLVAPVWGAEDKNAEAAQVSKGFEVFLTRISGRGLQGNTFASLNWVAETFAGLGAGFGDQEYRRLGVYVEVGHLIGKLVQPAARWARG